MVIRPIADNQAEVLSVLRLKDSPSQENGWIRGQNARPVPPPDPMYRDVCVYPIGKKTKFLPVNPETGRPLFQFRAPLNQSSRPESPGSGAPPPTRVGEEAGSARLNPVAPVPAPAVEDLPEPAPVAAVRISEQGCLSSLREPTR